jgi:hypothetical protein
MVSGPGISLYSLEASAWVTLKNTFLVEPGSLALAG